MIAVSCGIKISAVYQLALSQSMRVTDGRTDGQRVLRLPRPPSHMLVRQKWMVHNHLGRANHYSSYSLFLLICISKILNRIGDKSLRQQTQMTNLCSKVLTTHWTWIGIFTGLQTVTCLQSVHNSCDCQH